MIRRILAVMHARNLEFIRDRSSLAWNIAFPLLLVFGIGFIFSGGERPLFRVAVMANAQALTPALHPFLDTPYIHFFKVEHQQRFIRKVARHQVDMLLDLRTAEPRYWVNRESAKGYVIERLLRDSQEGPLRRETVEGQQIRYIDWLVPGILGMNMMFSCLFGVGYVIVRYRKNGYLKRLSATPLNALEFILAQIGSRLLLIMAATALVFAGTRLFIRFPMEGSYIDLFILAMAGATAIISLALIVAARVTNEELASGVLNIVGWPMMVTSGVWFSLEGTHPIIQETAQFLPLTQLLTGARAIMLDGAGLWDIAPNLLMLVIMSIIFLLIGAGLFKWTPQ
jgi:ABC-type multidrug transport system permease subunit